MLCVGTALWLDKLNLVTSTKACQSIFFGLTERASCVQRSRASSSQANALPVKPRMDSSPDQSLEKESLFPALSCVDS